jgi:hypothetical protein
MPKAEKALYATALKQIKNTRGYSRVYFGAEFCQWRLPSPAIAVKAFDRTTEEGMGFTLLTPWLTDAGIKKTRGILTRLADAGALDIEVVINDFGLLAVLKDEFPMFVPVLGRLLVKQKRCPRVPGIMEGLPQSGRDVYTHPGIEDPVTVSFLKRFGMRRVELDSTLQGVEVGLKALRLKGSIYTPYAYVTTTRNCPSSFDGKSWQAFTGCKIKGCIKNVIELGNPAHKSGLLMRGNTQFVENAVLPEDLAGMGIDRIVHMEELP